MGVACTLNTVCLCISSLRVRSSISDVSSVFPRWGIPSVGRIPLGRGVVATHLAVST